MEYQVLENTLIMDLVICCYCNYRRNSKFCRHYIKTNKPLKRQPVNRGAPYPLTFKHKVRVKHPTEPSKINVLTENCEIDFGVPCWRLLKVDPTPIDSSVGFPDALYRQLGRIVRIPEERSPTEDLLVGPVLRLVERFPSRIETAT